MNIKETNDCIDYLNDYIIIFYCKYIKREYYKQIIYIFIINILIFYNNYNISYENLSDIKEFTNFIATMKYYYFI